MDKYSFQCECGQVLTVSAENRNEAVDKLFVAGRKHIAEVHPEMALSDEELKNMLRSGMKQEAV